MPASDGILIYGDTLRDPHLRHAIPVPIGDSVLYAEFAGAQKIVCLGFEVPRLSHLSGIEVHSLDEFGLRDVADVKESRLEIYESIFADAIRSFGIADARVPESFPISLAEKLNGMSVRITSDRDFFADRRREKNADELEGIRRAQACAEAAMAAVAELLRTADPSDRVLKLDGTPLTVDMVRAEVAEVVAAHDGTISDAILSHGPQSAVIHEKGNGVFAIGEPIVVDLGPRDRASGCFADMTRTFVVGDAPQRVIEWHAICMRVLEQALGRIRPGAVCRAIFDEACQAFEDAGYPTQRTNTSHAALEEGFLHSLGHGVGLEVHEAPFLGLHGQDVLRVGDVIALEPGLYEPGFGGVRVEDLVLITDTGFELLTRYPYDLAP